MSVSISSISSARLGAAACSFQSLSSFKVASSFCTWRASGGGTSGSATSFSSSARRSPDARPVPPSRSAPWALPISALISRSASASAADFSAHALSLPPRAARPARPPPGRPLRAGAPIRSRQGALPARARLRARHFQPPLPPAGAIRSRCSAMIVSQRSMARAARSRTSAGASAGQRLPSRMEMPESRLVNGVVDTVAVPLERLAGAQGVAQSFGDLPLLGVERVAFLPDDLVNALVLAAQLLEQPFELRGVRHGLRRELPDAARGPLEDQLGPALGILDRGECAGQRTGIRCNTPQRPAGRTRWRGPRATPRSRAIPHRPAPRAAVARSARAPATRRPNRSAPIPASAAESARGPSSLRIAAARCASSPSPSAVASGPGATPVAGAAIGSAGAAASGGALPNRRDSGLARCLNRMEKCLC